MTASLFDKDRFDQVNQSMSNALSRGWNPGIDSW